MEIKTTFLLMIIFETKGPAHGSLLPWHNEMNYFNNAQHKFTFVLGGTKGFFEKGDKQTLYLDK
jgi:hypothetical protein